MVKLFFFCFKIHITGNRGQWCVYLFIEHTLLLHTLKFQSQTIEVPWYFASLRIYI